MQRMQAPLCVCDADYVDKLFLTRQSVATSINKPRLYRLFDTE